MYVCVDTLVVLGSCMCVCVYLLVYIYVHRCELILDMCIYVYVHIVAKTYLRGYVESVCMCDRMYFVQEPQLQTCEYK